MNKIFSGLISASGAILIHDMIGEFAAIVWVAFCVGVMHENIMTKFSENKKQMRSFTVKDDHRELETD
jgi:hypothetical protein